jgi:hypothetical protein
LSKEEAYNSLEEFFEQEKDENEKEKSKSR